VLILFVTVLFYCFIVNDVPLLLIVCLEGWVSYIIFYLQVANICAFCDPSVHCCNRVCSILQFLWIKATNEAHNSVTPMRDWLDKEQVSPVIYGEF